MQSYTSKQAIYIHTSHAARYIHLVSHRLIGLYSYVDKFVRWVDEHGRPVASDHMSVLWKNASGIDRFNEARDRRVAILQVPILHDKHVYPPQSAVDQILRVLSRLR